MSSAPCISPFRFAVTVGFATAAFLSFASGANWISAYAADRAPVKSLSEVRQENLIRQEFDISCGAAALATVMTFQHGDAVPEREVALALIERQEYIDNPLLVKARQGFSLLDLKRYADQRGYNGVGFGNLSLDDLVELAPIIVPIDTRGYNHFVVFRGVRGDRVLLGDPAWGNRTMRIDRFEHEWIDYGEIGKVGFRVERRDGQTGANLLAPKPEDFLTFG